MQQLKIRETIRSSLVIYLFLLFYTQSAAATIAAIKSEDIQPYKLALDGFKNVCKADYTEYNIESDIDIGHAVASELKKQRPDVILVLGAKAAYVISQDIKDIPIIFCIVAEPEKYGLSAPNITGIKYSIPVDIQIRIFGQMFPGVNKLGIIYSSNETEDFIKKAREFAKGQGIEIEDVRIGSKQEIPDTIDELLAKIDLLWLIYDPEVTSSEKIVTDTIILPSLQRKIPVVGFNKWSVTVGALLCMFSDYFAMGQEAGDIANKLLQGYKPSSIGIKSPQKVNIMLNTKVFKRVKEKMEIVVLDNTYVYEG